MPYTRCKTEMADANFEDRQTAEKEGGAAMIRINDTGDGIVVDDLLACIEMLGKTAAEIGIPREVINIESKYYIRTYVDGSIFGTKDYGILQFDNARNDPDDYLMKRIWIHIKHSGYGECKN